MGRIHAFELEDQSWFPTFLRNYGTDFLQYISQKTGMFKPIIPILEEALQKSGNTTIIDLGSGGGGGLVGFNRKLKKRIPGLKIVLTDYYPNLPAFKKQKEQNDNIDYESRPIDAKAVPRELKGLRTLFLSFHHFKPEDARQILQDAVDSGNAIAIFEGQERSASALAGILFSPAMLFISTPFIKPFKPGRIFFTYILPLAPLFILWDGIISVLRTYSEKEMKELLKEVKGREKFEWKVGKIKSGPGKLLYLIGTEKNNLI